MLLMLVDHTREFFYRHVQVADPLDLDVTPPALAAMRIAAHLCAPVFVALTGLGAFLYGESRGGAAAAAGFLIKRGLLLVVLEWTVVSVAWTFALRPQLVFLQVIWAIGLSMIALAALVRLPRSWLIAVGALLVLGHNLLDGIVVPRDMPGHTLWAILHERDIIDLPWGGRARTSYPILPWIGVIALGYAIGPWFRDGSPTRRLLATGITLLTGFGVLRLLNGYGEPVPWHVQAGSLRTILGFVNLTKYPPSALFVLFTLGVGALALAALGRLPAQRLRPLATFGAAPLFFYVLHLYLLHAANRAIGWAIGTQGGASVPGVAWLWGIALLVALPCWFACRRFAALKRASNARFLRYL